MAAAFEVYNEMGNGYTEDIYQESLEEELKNRSIPFLAQPELSIFYKNSRLKRKLRPDLIICAEMIVELKAATALTSEHEAQLLNYLKATGKTVGYLVNFGSKDKLQWKRFIRSPRLVNISAN